MSFLIKNNKLIARTDDLLKSGSTVEYAYITKKDMHGQTLLVNANTAQISNAKKWEKIAKYDCDLACLIDSLDAAMPRFKII